MKAMIRFFGAGNSAALAAPGYGVDVTTVNNVDGTKTSTYTVTHTGLLNGLFTINAGGIFYEGTFGYSSSDMGHYWTSTPNTNGNTKAYYLAFYHNVCEVRSGDTNSGDSGVYRSSRLSVRLVRSGN